MGTNNYVGEIPAAIAPGVAKADTIFARETGYGNRRRTVIEFKDHVIAGVDSTGTQFTQKLYVFPVGRILYEGGSIEATLEYSNAVGVNANADGDLGVGTVTGSGEGGFTATEQDLIPTKATLAASSIVTHSDGSTSTEAPKIFDGSSSAKEVWLNHMVDNADSDVVTTPTNVKVNGTLAFNWTYLGAK